MATVSSATVAPGSAAVPRGNVVVSVAVAIIFYFVNQRRMGEFRANAARNTLLGITLTFALALALIGVVRFFR
jgi:hypothetical protein